jgi:hypothetical protein
MASRSRPARHDAGRVYPLLCAAKSRAGGIILLLFDIIADTIYKIIELFNAHVSAGLPDVGVYALGGLYGRMAHKIEYPF